jgi:hypothetical protein
VLSLFVENYATVKKNPSWMDETKVGVGSQVQISVVCGSLSLSLYISKKEPAGNFRVCRQLIYDSEEN